MSDDPIDAGARYFRETTERFLFVRLVVEVREDGVYLRFAPIHRSFRRFPFATLEAAQATAYDPSTYRGWHWGIRRTVSGNRVYRLRGDRGVELSLADGNTVFIGSQRSTELESAIASATGLE